MADELGQEFLQQEQGNAQELGYKEELYPPSAGDATTLIYGATSTTPCISECLAEQLKHHQTLLIH